MNTYGYDLDLDGNCTSTTARPVGTDGLSSCLYTQDLVAPLSQILHDGSARYVYGHEVSSAGEW
jgi:hypothetical protein